MTHLARISMTRRLTVYLAFGALGVFPSLLPLRAAVDEKAPRLEPTTNPAALGKQLPLAQAEKDTAAEIEIYRRLLAAAPNDVELLVRLVRAQMQAGDYPRAHAALDLLTKAVGNRAEPRAQDLRGDLADAEDKSADALRAWGECLRAKPANAADVLEKIAGLQEKEDQWGPAANAWRDLLALGNDAGRRARLALCLLNAGRCDEAVSEMQAANALEPTNAAVKKELPRFEWLATQLPYWRTLEGQPQNNMAVQYARAEFYTLARVYPLAQETVSRVLEAFPASVSARCFKGWLLYKNGKPEEAAKLSVANLPDARWSENRTQLDRLRALDEAVYDDPKKAANYSRRAAELLALDQPALALPDAEQAVRLAPNSSDAAVLLAAALLRLDRHAEARAQALQATVLDPRNADSWAMLGRLEQDRAEFSAAIDAFSRALKSQEQVRWLQRREACLRAVGRNAEADRDQRRLEQIKPASPSANNSAPVKAGPQQAEAVRGPSATLGMTNDKMPQTAFPERGARFLPVIPSVAEGPLTASA